ncbi:MAG: NAD(P)-binding protein [Candidatus Wallbacteria bacterium]|nr:NAD(P)-binding protein [Candidatus Wallbacteria bacterium]
MDRKKISVNINGKDCPGLAGQTIFEVARDNGVFIPTLCHNERLKPYGSCWICLVEAEGARGFVPSCSFEARDGMKVRTDSPAVREARKMCLDFLLSNHYGDCVAPCQLQCPAGVDVQGFIAHIAHGDFRAATELHKEKNPFPLVCGRVCPRTCEDKCRRNLVDEPVAIAYLKRYFADADLSDPNGYRPKAGKPTGKKVAIVGAGPAGLTAAYFLAELGHKCVVFEALPKPGGMLRYGIPSYRLPREILEREIAYITDMGVEIETGRKLGRDFTIRSLRENGFNAILVAIGAHKGSSMRCKGEDTEGVLNGIEFLRSVSENGTFPIGKRVGVIGGGNTAIDAVRTALRLGASEVTLIYRRTEKEMPAWSVEVHEAREEGVKMLFLTAPLEVIGENGRVTGLKCQRMELGEPDKSGRRAPVPVSGSEFIVPLDNVIAAIGQGPDLSCLKGEQELVECTKWETIVSDKETCSTREPGLFAAGDVQTGPATAVEAIAGGRKAALAIDSWLKTGEIATAIPAVNVRKDTFHELTAEDFAQVEKKKRITMPMHTAQSRVSDFREVEKGLSPKNAQQEALRCLSCGCMDVFECKLRKFATDYQAVADRFLGAIGRHPIDETHPYIIRDPGKCIMCGQCIRTCLEIRGIGALGFVFRGFDVEVSPAMQKPLDQTRCDACGQCVSACPTGALSGKVALPKPGPWKYETLETACDRCSMLCPVEVKLTGCEVQAVSGSGRIYAKNICRRGSFMHTEAKHPLKTPYTLKGKSAAAHDFEEVATLIAGQREALFVAGSGVSCEEALIFNKIAEKITGSCACFADDSPDMVTAGTKIEDIGNRDLLVLCNSDGQDWFPVLDSFLRMHSRSNARVAFIGKAPDMENYSFKKLSVRGGADKIIAACTDLLKGLHKSSGEWQEFLSGKPVVVMEKDLASEELLAECRKLGRDPVILDRVCNGSGLRQSGLKALRTSEITAMMKDRAVIFFGENAIGLPQTRIALWFSPFKPAKYKGMVVPLTGVPGKSGTYFAADGRKAELNSSSDAREQNTDILEKVLRMV